MCSIISSLFITCLIICTTFFIVDRYKNVPQDDVYIYFGDIRIYSCLICYDAIYNLFFCIMLTNCALKYQKSIKLVQANQQQYILTPQLLIPVITSAICQIVYVIAIVIMLLRYSRSYVTEHPVYLWLVQTIIYASIFLMLMSIIYAHHNITEHVY